MYKIIGGDQKEYGPVSAEEIRRWIAEGRLSAQSWVRLEGTTEWKAVASFPEFAEALRAQSPAQGTPPPLMPPGASPQVLASQALTAPRVTIGSCLSRSLELLKRNFGLCYGATFVVWIMSLIAARIPFGLGLAIFFLLKGVFHGGLFLVFLKRIRGQPASLGDIFAGFQSNSLQLVLVGVVGTLLAWAAGICCLIIPGIYLFIAWLFAIPLVADRGLEFWSGLELSRKVVTRVWFEMLGLLLLAFLPYILTWVFVQIQMSYIAIPPLQEAMRSGPLNFKQITDLVTKIVTQQVEKGLVSFLILQLVWLLNWPFAIGALMYAYEDIFGARKSQSP